MCQEALDMERSHGEEGVEGKCRKDKGHDLWYRQLTLKKGAPGDQV